MNNSDEKGTGLSWRIVLILVAILCAVVSLYYLSQGFRYLDQFFNGTEIDSAIKQNAIATYAIGKLLIALTAALYSLVLMLAARHKE